MIDKINIILVAFIFITFIVFIIVQLVNNKKKINQMRENFSNQQKYNSAACCGNADWHLGEKEYNRECPDSTPPAFENTHGSHCSYIRENFTSNKDKKVMNECRKLGHKPAYNQICVQNEKLITNANCKCSDDLNNCKVCFPKIKINN